MKTSSINTIVEYLPSGVQNRQFINLFHPHSVTNQWLQAPPINPSTCECHGDDGIGEVLSNFESARLTLDCNVLEPTISACAAHNAPYPCAHGCPGFYTHEFVLEALWEVTFLNENPRLCPLFRLSLPISLLEVFTCSKGAVPMASLLISWIFSSPDPKALPGIRDLAQTMGFQMDDVQAEKNPAVTTGV